MMALMTLPQGQAWGREGLLSLQFLHFQLRVFSVASVPSPPSEQGRSLLPLSLPLHPALCIRLLFLYFFSPCSHKAAVQVSVSLPKGTLSFSFPSLQSPTSKAKWSCLLRSHSGGKVAFSFISCLSCHILPDGFPLLHADGMFNYSSKGY